MLRSREKKKVVQFKTIFAKVGLKKYIKIYIKKKKKKKKLTARGIPMWSPTIVLTAPDGA